MINSTMIVCIDSKWSAKRKVRAPSPGIFWPMRILRFQEQCCQSPQIVGLHGSCKYQRKLWNKTPGTYLIFPIFWLMIYSHRWLGHSLCQTDQYFTHPHNPAYKRSSELYCMEPDYDKKNTVLRRILENASNNIVCPLQAENTKSEHGILQDFQDSMFEFQNLLAIAEKSGIVFVCPQCVDVGKNKMKGTWASSPSTNRYSTKLTVKLLEAIFKLHNLESERTWSKLPTSLKIRLFVCEYYPADIIWTDNENSSEYPHNLIWNGKR